jgi:hypothetical protein
LRNVRRLERNEGEGELDKIDTGRDRSSRIRRL